MSIAIYLITLVFAMLHEPHSEGAVPVARASQMALCRVLSGSHKPSQEGTLDLSIARTRRGISTVYANAVADLNGDGIIAPYAVKSGKEQSEWIVRNVPLPVSGDGSLRPEFSIWFKFADMTVSAGDERNVAVILTDQPVDLDAPQALNDMVEWDIQRLPVQATGWGAEDQRGQRLTAHAASPSRRPHAVNDTLLSTLVPGPAVPDIEQQFNECGPTSAANSILWLAERYSFLQKLPAQSDGTPDTAQLVLDLMKSMAGTTDRPFRGLKGDQMFTGQKEFAEALHLPFTVEGGNGERTSRGAASFDFIAQHLARRQPSELLIWMPDGSGHWVTVTGCATEDSRALLFVHDPDDKKTATAVWELSVNNGGKPDGDLTLPGHCALGWAVSETPAPVPLQAAHQGGTQNTVATPADGAPILYSLDVN